MKKKLVVLITALALTVGMAAEATVTSAKIIQPSGTLSVSVSVR